jgi:hypothetical protein
MDAEKELKLLTDLEILSIGLVKKGANLSPFFLIKNLEGEVMEREQLEKELEELESVEEVSRSEWDRLLKVIRNLLPFKKEEAQNPSERQGNVEEKQEPAEAAAKKALEILQRFSHIEEIREAIKRLAAYVGYPYPYPYPYPKPKAEEVEMEDEKAKKAVKQALKILEPFRELEELKRAVALLATFVGYPYPKPARKSETEEALEKKLEALQKEALDYKRELEEVKKALEKERVEKRMKELEEISKSALGFPTEKLFELEKLSPELFKEVVDRLQAAHKQIEEAGLFKEIGSSQPLPAEEKASKMLLAKAVKLSEEAEISLSEALERISKEDKELYRRYLEERRQSR